MKKLFTMLFFLGALAAYGEEISVEEAVEMAMKNSKEIKMAEEELDSYKLQKKEAFKSGLPSVTFQGNYNKFEKPIDPTNSSKNNYENSITISQPIFMGGVIASGIRSSKDYLRLGEYNLKDKKNSVEILVKELYYGIVKLQNSKDVIEVSIKALSETNRKLARMYELNSITKADLLKVEYSLIELNSNLANIENMIKISKLQLKNELGIDSDVEIVISDGRKESLDVKSINIEEDLKKGLRDNIDVNRASITTKLTNEAKVFERSKLLPTVSMFANYKSNSVESISESFGEWEAIGGVQVSMTLFDWGKSYDAYKRAKNRTDIAKLNSDSAVDGIDLKIKQTYYSLLNIAMQIEAKKRAFESSEESYKLDSARYKENLISVSDFLESESSYRQSKIDLESLEIDYYLESEKYRLILNREVK